MKKYSSVLNIFFALFGILIFACFINWEMPVKIISFSGLILCISSMVITIKKPSEIFRHFGLHPINKKVVLITILAIISGFIFGMINRYNHGRNILPERFTYFVFVFCLIGISEELFFRGYLYEKLQKYNNLLTPIISILSHTLYKILIFMPYSGRIDLLYIFKWTIFGGIITVLFREAAKNTIAPAASHAIFDIIIYGDSTPPFWVW